MNRSTGDRRILRLEVFLQKWRILFLVTTIGFFLGFVLWFELEYGFVETVWNSVVFSRN